jgi:selenium metabolism protein YedF
MARVVDAVGLDCPKPVILTKEAVDSGEPELLVKVDNEVAVSNVTRFLEGRGYTVKRTDEKGYMALEGVKSADNPEKPEAKSADWGMLLLSNRIGHDSNGLGEVLMKSFLSAMEQNDNPPAVLGLMNDAVLMALPEGSTCDTLAELEKKGVRLLICGICTKHFGVTEKIKIGVISNMFEITEAIFGSAKPVVIG